MYYTYILISINTVNYYNANGWVKLDLHAILQCHGPAESSFIFGIIHDYLLLIATVGLKD